MKSKTTVLLIVALIACLAYIVARPSGPANPVGPDHVPESVPLLANPPGQPGAVTITSQSGRKISFSASDAGWRIAEPVATTAIDARINELVAAIVSIKRLQQYELTDSGAPDASVTGLAEPRWKVSISDTAGKSITLEIGQHVPLSGKTRTYVCFSDDKRVCVADGDFTELLSRPVGYYRSPNIMSVPAGAITAIRIEGSATYSLHLEADGRWIISSGTDGKDRFGADGREVKKLLARFAKIDALRFTDDKPADLAPYGLADGQQRLAVTVVSAVEGATEATSRTLAMGLKTGGGGPEAVYAKLADHPTVFTLRAAMLGDLQPDRLKLRDKAVLPITADAVSGIEITIDSEIMKLAKTGDKWSITEPVKVPGNQQRLALLLSRLASLRAKGFRSEKASEVEFGFKKPRGEIRIFQTGSDKPVTLTIGAESPAGAVAFVQSSSADIVAAVGSEEVAVFLAPLSRYYDSTLWVLPDRTDVSRIALKRPSDSVELTGSSDGKWRMTKPLDAPIDAENVNSILDHLDNLTATRIVSVGAKTRAYYARGARQISATFELRGQDAAATQPAPGARTFRMAILGGKVYGWMENDPLGRVGLFSGKIYRQLAAEVRDRKVIDFDTKSIAGIALATGGKVLVLQKFDSGWKYPGDLELKIDSDAVNGYLDHIKTARALRFVSSNAEVPDEKYGLKKSRAWLALELTTADRKTISILISRKGSDETANRYTSVSGLRGVFTISAETAAGLARKIADFK